MKKLNVFLQRFHSGLFAAALLAVIPNRLLASGTVTVCDEANLRAAFAGGGTVIFQCDGTITLSDTLVVTNNTFLDASGHTMTLSGNNAVRLITVDSNATLTLKNLTLADGLAQGTAGTSGQGGAILSSGNVIALDCLFLRNVARGGTGASGDSAGNGGPGLGGATYGNSGSLSVTNCSFKANSALGGTGGNSGEISYPGGGGMAAGGAIWVTNGTVNIVSCVLSNNLAAGGSGGYQFGSTPPALGGEARGGAIFNTAGNVWIAESILSGNTNQSGGATPSYGGAICQDAGNLGLIGTLIQSNVAVGTTTSRYAGSASGGGLNINGGIVGITNTTFVGNKVIGGDAPPKTGIATPAAGWGLGGALFNAGNLSMVNCTIAGNTARAGTFTSTPVIVGNGWGGAICNSNSASFNSVTIADNSAISSSGSAGAGGGIFVMSGTVMAVNTLLSSNTLGNNVSGTLTDLGHNLSSDTSASFAGPGSMNNTNPLLAPLDNYGGLTPTMALLSSSPAIDGADLAAAPTMDQRQRARPFGLAPDIGAFESSPPYVVRGTVTGATLKNEVMVAAGTDVVSTSGLGHYFLTVSASGSYDVIPQSPDYLFVPASIPITLGPDRFDVNFSAYHWNELSLDNASNGMMHITFATTNSAAYRLQTGTDLGQWSDVSTHTINTSNYWEVFLPIGDEASRFYRTVSP